METVYDEILEISNSIFIVEAENVEIGEMALVEKRDGTKLYGQVISFDGTKVVVQAMGESVGYRILESYCDDRGQHGDHHKDEP